MSTDIRLSKSKITAFSQCARRLWLEVHRRDLLDTADASSNARIDDGNLIDEVARRPYRDGILIDSRGNDQAAAETQKALTARRPVFQATFQHQGVVVKTDLLLPERGGWRLVEIKASNQLKDYHATDVAVQAWVVQGAGLNVTGVDLQHLNRTFVYPGRQNYRGLFTSADLREDVAWRSGEVPIWIDTARSVINRTEPLIEPGDHCGEPYDCPFGSYCESKAAKGPAYPVTLLPGHAGKKLARELVDDGYADLRKVPAKRIPEGVLERIYRVTKSGEPYFDKRTASEQMKALAYPRYYLDFETVALALPLWVGLSPYQKVPFQWSCHIERATGVLEHVEFLDLSGVDPSRSCAEKLLATLGRRGSIVSYNASFEKGVISSLAERHADLAERLEALLARFFDPQRVAKETWYHRDMLGSWSIKAVLPTIAPELSYAGLDVSDGGEAEDAFRVAVHPGTGREERDRVARELRRYCALDTWAMVRLCHFLEGRPKPRQPEVINGGR